MMDYIDTSYTHFNLWLTISILYTHFNSLLCDYIDTLHNFNLWLCDYIDTLYTHFNLWLWLYQYFIYTF